MTPTGQLKDEHSGIKVMLNILEKVCDRLEKSEPVDPDHLDRILDFLKVFVDKCHHAKEEDLLFPEMERAGIPREGGPIGVMLSEHRTGREYIRGMGESAERCKGGDRAASARFVRNARGYIELLRQHIDKEDHILYPMADARIPEKRQRDLLAEFEKVEEERVGHGRHEEFHGLLDRLKSVYLA